MNNKNNARDLEDFLEEDKSPPYFPRNAVVKEKNITIILLCFIFVVGLVILPLQIFSPFDNNGNNELIPQNQQDYVSPFLNGPDTYGNSGSDGKGKGGSDTYGYSNPNRNASNDGYGLLANQNEDGTTWYSSNNGKTWSHTIPEDFDISQ